MARQRLIKPGFFTNEDLGECSPLARLMFAGLWCWGDRLGRTLDRPRRLRAEILPYDRVDGEDLIAELAAHGMIERYEVDGIRVIQIVNFGKHQDPHPRETPSELPGKPEPRSTEGEPKADLDPAKVPPRSPSPSSPSRSLSLADVRAEGANARAAIEASRRTHADEPRTKTYPRTASLLVALTAAKEPGAWPKDDETCAVVEAGIGSQPLDAVVARVAASIKASGLPWLGHHTAAVKGVAPPAAKRSRGMATPDTDWTSEAATKL